MNAPQATLLPDGKRLHLNHGPIDLVIAAEGAGREAAFAWATKRFQTILTELVEELASLRQPYQGQRFSGPVARRMALAVAPFAGPVFVTPMAAVAGAVADEVLASMAGCKPTKASVNNGGDVAFLLSEGVSIRAVSPTGPIEIRHGDGARGMATSGWRGRSQSLGIADAVTVIADTAAMADVAATLIANTVNLPGHPAIARVAAREIEVAPELNDLLVTTDVGPLTPKDVAEALDRGATFASDCLARGLIHGAVLLLDGETRAIESNVLPDNQKVAVPGLS